MEMDLMCSLTRTKAKNRCSANRAQIENKETFDTVTSA